MRTLPTSGADDRSLDRRRRCVRIAALLCLLAAPVRADESGTLRGRVTDAQGRALAGATITVRGDGAVGRYRTTTDPEGQYRIPGLPPREELDVRAEVPGLPAVVYSGVVARSGSGTRRDFRLRPAASREWLVALDRRIPFHEIALASIRETLTPPPRVIELTGRSRDDLRSLREALRRRPSAVIAVGDDAAGMARRWIRDVPVIYTMVVDPEGGDLTTDNLCGLRLNAGFEAPIRRLRAVRPGARVIATIHDPRTLSRDLGALREAARDHGFRVVSSPARSPHDVEAALDDLAHRGIDAFYLLLDPQVIDAGAFERIRRFTAQRRIPFVVPDRSLVAVGGTFSEAPGFAEMGVHAARIAAWIAAGRTTPREVGTRFPTIRSFAINPHEADRLGIPMP